MADGAGLAAQSVDKRLAGDVLHTEQGGAQASGVLLTTVLDGMFEQGVDFQRIPHSRRGVLLDQPQHLFVEQQCEQRGKLGLSASGLIELIKKPAQALKLFPLVFNRGELTAQGFVQPLPLLDDLCDPRGQGAALQQAVGESLRGVPGRIAQAL